MLITQLNKGRECNILPRVLFFKHDQVIEEIVSVILLENTILHNSLTFWHWRFTFKF